MEFATCVPSSEWGRKVWCLRVLSTASVLSSLDCVSIRYFSPKLCQASVKCFGAGRYIYSGDMATGPTAFYFHKSVKNSLRMMYDKAELITVHRR